MAKQIQVGLDVQQIVTESQKAVKSLTEVGKATEDLQRKLNKKVVGPAETSKQLADNNREIVKATASYREMTNALKGDFDGRFKLTRQLKAELPARIKVQKALIDGLSAKQKDLTTALAEQKSNNLTKKTLNDLAEAKRKASIGTSKSATGVNKQKEITERLKGEKLLNDSAQRQARIEKKNVAELEAFIKKSNVDRLNEIKLYTARIAAIEGKLTLVQKKALNDRINDNKIAAQRRLAIQKKWEAEIIKGSADVANKEILARATVEAFVKKSKGSEIRTYEKHTKQVEVLERRQTESEKRGLNERVNANSIAAEKKSLLVKKGVTETEKANAARELAAKRARAAESEASPLAISFKSIARIVGVSLGFRAFSGLIAGIKGATEAALGLSKAVTEIQTISQQQGVGFDAWVKGLLAVSNAAGIDVLNQAEAAYQALSNQVVDAADTFLFLEEANKLAFATVSTTSTAINVLSSSMNSYGLTVNEAANLSATYFKVIELGRLRLEDLEQTFGKLEVIGDSLGISLDEIGAAMATLTNQGIKAREASTQLRGIMNKLIKPTDALKDLFRELGVSSGQEAIRIFEFSGFLKILSERAKEGNAELGKLINRQRGLTGALVLSGRALVIYEENLAKIREGSESYEKATELVSESSFKTVQRFTTEISNAFIGFGVTLSDALAATIGFFSDLGIGIKDVANLIKGTLIASAIGLIRSIGAIGTAIRTLSATILASPIGGFAAAALAAGAAYAILTNIIDRTSVALVNLAENTAKLNQANLNEALDNTTAIIKQIGRIEKVNLRVLQRVRRATEASQKGVQDAYKLTAVKTTNAFKAIETEFKKVQENIRKEAETGLSRFTSGLAKQAALANQLLNIRIGEISSKNEESREEKILKLKERQAQLARDAEESGKLLNTSKNKELANEIARIQQEEATQKKIDNEIQLEIANAKAQLDKNLVDAGKAESIALKEAHALRVAGLKQRRIAIALDLRQFDKATELAKASFDDAVAKQKELYVLKDALDEEQFLKRLKRERTVVEFANRLRQSVDILKGGQKEINSEVKTGPRIDIITGQIESLTAFLKINTQQKLGGDTEAIEKRLALLQTNLAGNRETLANETLLAPLKKNLEDLTDATGILKSEIQRNEASLVAQTALAATINADPETQFLLQSQRKAYDTLLRPEGGTAEEFKELKAIINEPIRPEEIKALATSAFLKNESRDELGGSQVLTRTQSLLLLSLQKAATPDKTREEVKLDQALLKQAVAAQTASADKYEAATLFLARKGDDDTEKFKTIQVLLREQVVIAERVAAALLTKEQDVKNIFPKINEPETKSMGGAIKYFSQGGGPKGTDTVPAWLTPGEFVVRKSMADKHRGLLSRLNSGYYENGGFVGQITPSAPSYYNSGGNVGDTTSVGNINVTLNSSGASNIIDARAMGNALKKEIRRGRLQF